MVTQNDVAKKAGVSFMTVSRVINNKTNVKEKTREKILKAIKELSYYPNSLGRGLNMNKTFAIGILIPFTSHIFSTPYYIELLNGVEKACAENNYSLILYPKKEEYEEIDYQRPFFERKVDGLLIIAPRQFDKQLKKIQEKNIPCVVVDGRQTAENIIFIDSDNKKGAFKATETLIHKGHKRIAFISGWNFVTNGNDRMAGYKDALLQYQIPLRDEYIINGEFSEESGYHAMLQLINCAEKPTAIFAANDLMAIGAVRAIKEKGFNVPDDFSIIGFDDIKMTSYISPALSTVRQHSYEMGYTAATLLNQKINDHDKMIPSKIFDVEVIIRDSIREI